MEFIQNALLIFKSGKIRNKYNKSKNIFYRNNTFLKIGSFLPLFTGENCNPKSVITSLDYLITPDFHEKKK